MCWRLVAGCFGKSSLPPPTDSESEMADKPISGYDVLNATNNFLAHAASEMSVVTIPDGIGGGSSYADQIEKLTLENADKEKQIEKLMAEKEEFSVFLIRDLLAAQKQAEDLHKEVESLKRQLTTVNTAEQKEQPSQGGGSPLKASAEPGSPPPAVVALTGSSGAIMRRSSGDKLIARPATASAASSTTTSSTDEKRRSGDYKKLTDDNTKLQATVVEMADKIRALENQLRAAKSDSPVSLSPDLVKSRRASLKSPDVTNGTHGTHGTHGAGGGDSSNSRNALPVVLEVIAEENAIESKKREMELTKAFVQRKSSIASKEPPSSALKWRLEKGAKMDVFDKDGYLLIHLAVIEDRWDAVKDLLHLGADVNAFDARGETSLHIAVRRENVLMIDYLCVYQASTEATGTTDKSTPLHLSAALGFTKPAASLIKEGANLEARTDKGYTPLRVAINNKKADFAAWLIESYKVNVDTVDDLGEHILTYGARIGKASMIDFMIDQGASVDKMDGRNLSALMVAARSNNVELITMLVNREAKVDLANSDGKTALHFAASAGGAAAAQALLEHGANVDAKDLIGNTPLHESCKQSHFEVSGRLIAWKAELTAKGGDGLTPLALAQCNNDNDTVSLLTENGAQN